MSNVAGGQFPLDGSHVGGFTYPFVRGHCACKKPEREIENMMPKQTKVTKPLTAQPNGTRPAVASRIEKKPAAPQPQTKMAALPNEPVRSTSSVTSPKPSTASAATSPKTSVPSVPSSALKPSKGDAVAKKADAPGQTANATFVLHAPQAKHVSVSGDFNKWSPDAAPMKRRSDGRWETALLLRPGRYQYKFVADGQWLHDPNARESVPNVHGSLNSVIDIPSA
jgi:hypothetical protein